MVNGVEAALNGAAFRNPASAPPSVWFEGPSPLERGSPRTASLEEYRRFEKGFAGGGGAHKACKFGSLFAARLLMLQNDFSAALRRGKLVAPEGHCAGVARRFAECALVGAAMWHGIAAVHLLRASLTAAPDHRTSSPTAWSAVR